MCVHYRVKTRCPDCLASGDADKEMARKIPRGQGWNAKRLRDDGIEEGKGEVGVGEGEGAEGEGARAQPMASLHPAGIKKLAPAGGLGGVKKSSVQRLGLQGEAAAESWELEREKIVQENQQLRSEIEERRRQAAELEKAKAEIERLKNLLPSSPTASCLGKQQTLTQPPPPPPPSLH